MQSPAPLVGKTNFSGLSFRDWLGRQNRNGLRSVVGPEPKLLLFLAIDFNLFLINRGARHFFTWVLFYIVAIKLVHPSDLL